jgi:hypothetical protein
MTPAARALLDKSRRGEPITADDKLTAIDTVADVEMFRLGLVLHGIDTPEALGACARRKAEIQRMTRST